MPDAEVALAAAVEAFFADKDLAPTSRRAYRQTLDALIEDHGPGLAVAQLTPGSTAAAATNAKDAHRR